MLQFIPFEDDWDALEHLRPEQLIPYRVGLLPEPAVAVPASELATRLAARSSVPTEPSSKLGLLANTSAG